jgi:hypothetical protein
MTPQKRGATDVSETAQALVTLILGALLVLAFCGLAWLLRPV